MDDEMPGFWITAKGWLVDILVGLAIVASILAFVFFVITWVRALVKVFMWAWT